VDEDYTQQDLESLNLSLNEAIDVAQIQNHPLWRMMSMLRGATHLLHARNG